MTESTTRNRKSAPTSQQTVGPNNGSDRQSIQVIERAGAILRALQHHPNGLSLGEIAAEVDLPRSTVQRIVDALDREAIVIAASASTHGVRLGPALIALGAATRFEIADMARPTLERLAKETNETVDLSIFDQQKAIFIDQVTGNQRLRAVSAIGVAFPLHCTANGKAILAATPAPALERMRSRMQLESFTKNTITSWPELERELQQVRRSGVAFDREEHSLGICAVGTALHSPTGQVAAISIPVPSIRFAKNEAALAKALLQHCEKLRSELSWELVGSARR
jgi:DNA-binding IclR family transcriptional regulator